MRFKKGSRVEVMNKKEVPISWRTAEICSGNGHTYSVHYDYHPVMDCGSLIERVSRKLVRPCPPSLLSDETREAGDTVEVFDNLSWKIATILKVMPGDYYMVRLLGCSIEFIVHKLNIRDQLLWLDDKWILMGKSSGACGVEQVNNLSTSKYCQKKGSDAERQRKAQNNCSEFHNKTGLKEPHKVFSRSLKRADPCWSSVIESHVGNSKKRRAVEKDGRRQTMAPPPVVGKVDAVAYPREVLGESHAHTLFDDRMIGSNEPKSGKFNCTAGFHLPGKLQLNDSDSVNSSVGSCSINSVGQKGSPNDFALVAGQVSDSICSDAESFSKGDEEESCSLSPEEEEVAVSIHGIELYAYHRTLEALHASGPLSWEQESLLTNLRIMLHVSNDEHLMEIRYLLSDQNGAYHR